MTISVNEESTLEHKMTRSEKLLCWKKKKQEFHALVESNYLNWTWLQKLLKIGPKSSQNCL